MKGMSELTENWPEITLGDCVKHFQALDREWGDLECWEKYMVIDGLKVLVRIRPNEVGEIPNEI